MKIAVIGSTGYIGRRLVKAFGAECSVEKILKIDLSGDAEAYLNLQNADQFHYSLLEDIDYVVFTAAVSGPDRCAADFDFCWSVNVAGTGYFIEKATERGCRVIFFSSDAVFGDLPGEIYTEESETRAATPYGRMKKAVEDKFKGNPYFKAVRLSYVVSANDRFLSYCRSCIEKEKTAEVFHPFYRNCITMNDVIKTVGWMTKNWDAYQPFVLNVAGKELVSRVRIADEINRCFDHRLNYTIVKPGGDFYKNHPPIIQMKSLYLSKRHIWEDNTFTEKIRKELESLINA